MSEVGIVCAGLLGEPRRSIAKALAKEGLGIDDILVRMKLGREWRTTIAIIVLRRIK